MALPELLDDARRRHGLLNSAGVQVAFQAADCVVRVDPVWFRQAVDNLVDNALRHTPPGGRVEVRAARQGDSLTVIVEDTGPGFDEAFLGAAFEPFTRARSRRCGRWPCPRGPGAGTGVAGSGAVARTLTRRVQFPWLLRPSTMVGVLTCARCRAARRATAARAETTPSTPPTSKRSSSARQPKRFVESPCASLPSETSLP
jgi:hypothetical protein